MRLRRKNAVRLISYTLAIIAALFGAWGQTAAAAAAYKLSITNRYNSSLTDLTNYLSNINDTIEKQMYTGTNKQMAQLSSELSKQATGAKASLSLLPVKSEVSEKIYKFLSQIGDYSYALSKKLANGEQLSENERKNLLSLKSYADELNKKFTDIQLVMSEKNDWNIDVQKQVDELEKSAELSEFYSSIEDITQTETEYPTLIYDGPFSDHIDAKKPKLTENKEEISKDAAKRIAAEYMNLADESTLADSGEESSSIASFVFANKGSVAAITKKGGYCVYFSKSRAVDNVKLSEQQAVEVAEKFLAEKLKTTFTESYFFVSDNICTINFAYSESGTVCYSDLVKIGVALDNGEVLSYEARGFIMNHHKREKPADIKSLEDAKGVLSPLLTVKSSNTAIILSSGLTEYFCYEFVCKGQNDEDILVFVNAKTLEEENIMILIKTDGGTLTR